MIKLEDYLKKKKLIVLKTEEKLRELAKEYAFSNKVADIGDIVTDHYCCIKVDKISYTSGSIGVRAPQCVYGGICHTKQMKPFKSQKREMVYEENIKEVNGNTGFGPRNKEPEGI